LAVVFK